MAASSSSAAESLRRDRILSSKLYFDVSPSKVAVFSLDLLFAALLSTIIGSCDSILERISDHEDRVCLVWIEWKFDKLYQRQIPIYVSRVQNTVPQVALLSNYLVQNRVLYPYRKQSGTKTKEYLDKLDEALEVARNDFDPELMVSDAAIDVLDGDPLVRLKVCPDGVSTRDDIVFRFARERNIPLVMLTSGGFMKSSAEATVDSIINLFNRNLIDLDRPLPLC
ncbi:hypothetical protein C4D60_Mb07t20100 [Musa balbisiana]|uniref:Histone deacetylase domain-containing protein n=1 Tax=Musa balbisiana TaxID=52838 RepID=A0A4V4H6T6_MUSBA|nr:hypothetical protein C4D60_Mb07t20100 [Musa balbisiana]